jgi:hypothetical protein
MDPLTVTEYEDESRAHPGIVDDKAGAPDDSGIAADGHTRSELRVGAEAGDLELVLDFGGERKRGRDKRYEEEEAGCLDGPSGHQRCKGDVS